jgi:hypothetical protein
MDANIARMMKSSKHLGLDFSLERSSQSLNGDTLLQGSGGDHFKPL